jgi:hypothetical protein
MVDAIVTAAKAVYGKPGDFENNAVRQGGRIRIGGGLAIARMPHRE